MATFEYMYNIDSDTYKILRYLIIMMHNMDY